MSSPDAVQSTYALLGDDWSEESLDWKALHPGPLPPPLLDDIDWIIPPKKPGEKRKLHADYVRRKAIETQASHSVRLDKQRALTFGTYEATVMMDSRDLFYKHSVQRRDVNNQLIDDWDHYHVDLTDRPVPFGWALVPCVAMRLCEIDGVLHVHATRYAEDIWGSWDKNERSPFPGYYDRNDDFSHNHPLPVNPPRVLRIPIANWLRRPLQMLFHTAAYLYYHRCQDVGSVGRHACLDRRLEAYYHELMSNLFTEFCELTQLRLDGHLEGPVEYLSCLQAHLFREWCQDGASCHTAEFSGQLLRILPYIYQQDASQLDWEGAYWPRASSLWRYTMTRDSLFAFWRMHRSLALDFYTDDFLLDFGRLHTVLDINFIPRRKGARKWQWCILAGATAAGFDKTPEQVPSDLYPIAEYKRDVKSVYTPNMDADDFLDDDDDEVDKSINFWTELYDYEDYGAFARASAHLLGMGRAHIPADDLGAKKAKGRRTGRNEEELEKLVAREAELADQVKAKKAAKKARRKAREDAAAAPEQATGDQQGAAQEDTEPVQEQQGQGSGVDSEGEGPAGRSPDSRPVLKRLRRASSRLSATPGSSSPQDEPEDDLDDVESQMVVDKTLEHFGKRTSYAGSTPMLH
ncbi:hypothetical protein AURDEDRAFT_123505 [Auricularia subglabra TFB-10046 SS5]|nr:hypothetical protein AURDEDRAFT_123505 [Auricularia subglabra TFB-10046 SS5]